MLGQAWCQPKAAGWWVLLLLRLPFEVLYYVWVWRFHCACVWKRLAWCPAYNPVKHLNNGGTSGLASLHPAPAWSRGDGLMCAAFRRGGETRKRWTNLSIYWSSLLSIYLFYPSSSLPQVTRGCSLGLGAPSILMVKYWHRCCRKIERPTCAISPAAGPGSSRGRLL